ALLEALEDAFDLCPGGADRDQAVAEAPGLLGRDRTGRGHVDRWRLGGHRPQPDGLHPVVGAAVLDVLATEELAKDFDCLEHSVDALGYFRPVIRHPA